MKKNNAFASFIDEKYIPLDNKLKVCIAVILFLLPAVLFYFLWFQPQNEEKAKLVKKRNLINAELQQAKKKASNRAKLHAELKATEELFQQTATLLPKEKEIPNLLTNISSLGRGSGLDFISFKPGKDVPRDFYSEIPISIKVKGPYHNMGVFLDQVSKLDRIVTVSDISMGGPKREGGEMLLNSDCKLVTYRFTNVKVSKPEDKKKKRRRR